MKFVRFDVFDSECAANVLQLATRAVTPHQREVQYDYPAVSFSLSSLLILATAILEEWCSQVAGPSEPDAR
jgi:hypothetical protein